MDLDLCRVHTDESGLDGEEAREGQSVLFALLCQKDEMYDVWYRFHGGRKPTGSSAGNLSWLVFPIPLYHSVFDSYGHLIQMDQA